MTEQEPKLCPFRKSYKAGEGWFHTRIVPDADADKEDGPFYENFGPCLQDKCAMWQTYSMVNYEVYKPGQVVPMDELKHKDVGYCGLAGKP